jgi:hypothetical protein
MATGSQLRAWQLPIVEEGRAPCGVRCRGVWLHGRSDPDRG